MAEIVIAMSIFSALTLVIASMMVSVFQAPRSQSAAIEQIDQARAVSNKFINEIRSAIYCADNNSAPISYVSNTQIIFCIDSKRGNDDRQLDIDKIRYYKSGNILYKGVTSPSFSGTSYVYTSPEIIKQVLSGLDTTSNAPLFSYYKNTFDGTGNPLRIPIAPPDTMSDIQFVKISLPIIKQSLSPAIGPSLSGWSYRKKITIDNTNVDADLTDFPLYVKIEDDAQMASAKSDGSDIRFTAGDGTTMLSYERESWTGGGGADVTANFWVKVPVISSSIDTDIYIYYGNLDAEDNQDAGNVWDSNFVGVWHLNETGTNPTVYDSTSNVNNSTSQAWTPTTGQIGGAGSFNGSNQDIGFADSSSLSITGAGLTLSAWIYCNSGGNDDILHKESHYSLFKNSSTTVTYADSITWSYATIGSYGTVSDGQWNRVVATFNGSTIAFYNNGWSIGNKSRSGSLTDNANSLYIGSYNHSSNYFSGKIDEVRVSNTVRSDAWNKFEYYNMKESDAEILPFGGEESVQEGEFLEQLKENTFTITAGATIRILRSQNAIGTGQ